MKYLTILAAVCLLMVPSVTSAQRDSPQKISPNPNPEGNLINVQSNNAFNNEEFLNNGVISIERHAWFNNQESGRFVNNGYLGVKSRVFNFGQIEISDTGVLENNEWGQFVSGHNLVNRGWIQNRSLFGVNSGSTFDNYGTLDNYYGEYGPGGNLHSVFDNNGTFNNYGGVVNKGGWQNDQDGRLINHQGATFDNWSDGAEDFNGWFLNSKTIENFGAFNNVGVFENYGAIVNHSTFTNDGNLKNADGNTLETATGGTLTNGGIMTNSGTLTFRTGSTFDNTGGRLTNSGGRIESYIDDHYFALVDSKNANFVRGTVNLESGTTFANYANMTITGTLNNAAGMTLENGTGGTLSNDGIMTNNGTLTFRTGSTFDNTGGKLTNASGRIESYIDDYYFALADSSNANFVGGTVNLESGTTFANYANMTATGNLNNAAGMTLENGTGGTLTNNGTLTNDGALVNEGILFNHGTLDNSLEGTLTNNGTIDMFWVGEFTNNGTLNGSGTIIGRYTDHGQTKPGNSAGVMTIDGDYFKVEGSKEIELGGLFDGDGDKALTEHDWLEVTGDAELSGTLDVKLIDGFDLDRGNVFNFLRVGGILSGQYDGLSEGDLVGNFGGQDLFITYRGGDGNDVALFTNAVPEPTTTVLIWTMLAGLGMTGRRRR